MNIYAKHRRRVAQYSCGATSAVAAKLTIQAFPSVAIVNAFVAEEDADNRRFASDCERWFGMPITTLRDEKYRASAYEVFRRVRYVVGGGGAPCSRKLKRDVLNAWKQPDDVAVIGYTIEEQDRADRFIDANNIAVEFPLIDAGLTKADCLAIVERAGIELPRTYRMGYANANCIGCPKGGEGYWNKVRRDFPERYEEMAKIQDELGPGSHFFRDRKTGVRISLRQLDPKAGRHDEPEIECGFACLMAEKRIEGQ
jgi:3'-phosphoadenosine 5'-phosphosulfate sulfotransferase (PAPS reductase)/FAD synthetase